LFSGLICTLFFMPLWLWFFIYFWYYLIFILSLLCSCYFVYFRLLMQHVLWRWSSNIHVRRRTLSFGAFKFNFMLWKEKLDNYLNIECWNFKFYDFQLVGWSQHCFLKLLKGAFGDVNVNFVLKLAIRQLINNMHLQLIFGCVFVWFGVTIFAIRDLKRSILLLPNGNQTI